MDVLESELKTFLFSAPKWMQLEMQGFWYGLISRAITCKEEQTPFVCETTTIETLLQYADPEFSDWPTSWLEPYIQQFLALTLTQDQLQEWFERLELLFRDSVPTDLVIFTTLANGELLTEEQWKRLYDALAFIPPPIQSKRTGKYAKTRHLQGRRALTPMKTKRATTHKKRSYSFIKLT
jgi:hypothetical protein